jgi:hypothetical protein
LAKTSIKWHNISHILAFMGEFRLDRADIPSKSLMDNIITVPKADWRLCHLRAATCNDAQTGIPLTPLAKI